MLRLRCVLSAAVVLFVSAALASAEKPAEKSVLDSLKSGDPDIKSAGPLAFGPEGILFLGDAQGGAIFALDTGDRTPATKTDERPKVAAVNEKIASLLGIESSQLLINDLAANPISGNAYLSVSRGKGPDAKPVIVRVGRDGKLSELALKNIRFARAELPNAAEGKKRAEAITGLAYSKGQVIVAGLSTEEFASKLRLIPFPFTGTDKGTSIEIFHGSHGKLETASPVRTFVPYEIGGEAHILAAYTCTPLVKIPLSQLKPGEKVRGVTIAELGNGNRPLDMIVYKKGGKEYILLSNSKRGIMKIPTEGIEKIEAITNPVKTGTAGLKYETIESLKGIEQLTAYDTTHALTLMKVDDKTYNLEPIELP